MEKFEMSNSSSEEKKSGVETGNEGELSSEKQFEMMKNELQDEANANIEVKKRNEKYRDEYFEAMKESKPGQEQKETEITREKLRVFYDEAVGKITDAKIEFFENKKRFDELGELKEKLTEIYEGSLDIPQKHREMRKCVETNMHLYREPNEIIESEKENGEQGEQVDEPLGEGRKENGTEAGAEKEHGVIQERVDEIYENIINKIEDELARLHPGSEAYGKIEKFKKELALIYAEDDSPDEMYRKMRECVENNSHSIEELEKSSDQKKEEAEEIEIEESGEIEEGEEEVVREEDQTFEGITKEQDERLKELGKQVKASRREYVVKDHSMDKNASIFKKFFGVGKRAQLGEFTVEYESAKERYEETLKEYKDALMEVVGDNEEAEMMGDWLSRTEYLDLQKDRADVKVENANWPDKLVGRYMEAVEGYRKLSFKKKLLIGAGLIGTGLATSAAGGALAIGGVAAVSVMRIFSMSASSAGFKAMFEGISKKRTDKKSEKEVAQDLEASKIEGAEDVDPEIFNRKLDEKIGKIDGKLQERKQWDKWRSWMAVGSGVALSMVGRYVGKEVMEHFQGGESAVEVPIESNEPEIPEKAEHDFSYIKDKDALIGRINNEITAVESSKVNFVDTIQEKAGRVPTPEEAEAIFKGMNGAKISPSELQEIASKMKEGVVSQQEIERIGNFKMSDMKGAGSAESFKSAIATVEQSSGEAETVPDSADKIGLKTEIEEKPQLDLSEESEKTARGWQDDPDEVRNQEIENAPEKDAPYELKFSEETENSVESLNKGADVQEAAEKSEWSSDTTPEEHARRIQDYNNAVNEYDKGVAEMKAEIDQASAEKIPEAEPVKLIVKEGSSLEGSIIKHLKANPDLIEKYNEVSGGRNFDSGQIAHRMALEFAKENASKFPDGVPDLIHAGAEINIDPEGVIIVEVNDPKGLGYLAEKEMPSPIESSSAAESVEVSPDAGAEVPLEEMQVEKLDVKIELTPKQAEMANTIRERLSFADEEKWNQMKGLTREEAWERIPEARERISDMNRTYTEVFSKAANAKPGETMEHWTARLSQMIVKEEAVVESVDAPIGTEAVADSGSQEQVSAPEEVSEAENGNANIESQSEPESAPFEDMTLKSAAIRKEIAGDIETWDKIKGMTHKEAYNNYTELQKNFNEIGIRYGTEFGMESNAQPGETLEHWTDRISKMSFAEEQKIVPESVEEPVEVSSEAENIQKAEVPEEEAVQSGGDEKVETETASEKEPVDWSKAERVEPASRPIESAAKPEAEDLIAPQEMQQNLFLIRHELAGDTGTWNKIKDMTYDQAEQKLQPFEKQRLYDLAAKAEEKFGTRGKPILGKETLHRWTQRLIIMSKGEKI